MPNKVLWNPSFELIDTSHITQFINEVNQEFGLNITSYSELHEWSIAHIDHFWKKVLSFSDIIYKGEFNKVIDDRGRMPGGKWFRGIELNYAEKIIK